MAVRNFRVSDLDNTTEVTIDSTYLTLNGKAVSIDLTDKELETLTKYLHKYFENGVEVTAKTRNGNAKPANSDDAERNAEIRAWAQVNGNLPEGVKVPADRGRLSVDVINAFDKHVANAQG